ncbi:MAG: universal stress protein [Bacteroidota bacterium]
MSKETIVVPVNGTPMSLVVLPIAQQMACLLEATIRIIHIGGEPPSEAMEGLRKVGLSPSELEGMVFEQLGGEPAEAILSRAEAWKSSMIVMCTHTAADHPRGHLGSVAKAVLLRSRIPVLFVQPERGRAPWEMKQLLLPHDGTPTTTAAIAPAVELAYRIGAELDVLHVMAPGASRPAEPGSYVGPYYVDQPAHEWPAWGNEFLERIRGMAHIPSVLRMHMFMVRGNPGAVIVDFAREHAIDLIVLAWHGVFEGEQALTMKHVIHHASCPVLVLRVKPDAGRP